MLLLSNPINIDMNVSKNRLISERAKVLITSILNKISSIFISKLSTINNFWLKNYIYSTINLLH